MGWSDEGKWEKRIENGESRESEKERERKTERELAQGRTVPFECSELGQRQTMVEALIFSPTRALKPAWLPALPSVAAKCPKFISRPLERGVGDEDRSWETRRGN